MLGLDLQGGLRVTLVAEPESDEPIQPAEQWRRRASIIERRVAGIGVSEPQVRTETGGDGSQRIVVEVPGVSDQSRSATSSARPASSSSSTRWARALTDEQDISALIEAGTVGVLFDGGEIDVGERRPGRRRQRHRRRVLAQRRRPATSGATSRPRTSTGPDRSRSTARSSPTPTIQQRDLRRARRSSRSARTTPANEVERTNLYNTLRFGALPISLTEQSVETVDPTLGAGLPRQALVAGAVGLALVLFFMIAYYRLPGVLAAIALIFYTLVVYAIFRVIHVTLTLAGRRRLHPLASAWRSTPTSSSSSG